MRQMRLPLNIAALAAVLVLAGCGGSSHPKAAATSSTSTTAATPRAAVQAKPYPRLAAPANAPRHSVRVPILTYHRVHTYATELTKSIPDLTIEPPVFAAEMAALSRAGYHTVTQQQLFEAMYRGAALPPKPVLISVDDGYVDDVTQILPVLRRERMVATFYVITGRFHEPGFLRQSQVRELEAAGMDIGDHTRTHANLPALGPAALTAEVAGSRADLERVVGHPVYWFAYPYGAFDQHVVAAVRSAGYLLATTTQGGSTESTAAPLTIPRIHVGRAATPQSVLQLVRGGGAAASGTSAG